MYTLLSRMPLLAGAALALALVAAQAAPLPAHADEPGAESDAAASSTVSSVLGDFDIPEGARHGVWGSDAYAAPWYLDATTLVVGPGVIGTSCDFDGMRASITRIRFTRPAYYFASASHVYEGFTALEEIENAQLVSGEYGILSAERMFAGCPALRAIEVGDITFSNVMNHPYDGTGVSVCDVTSSCLEAFEGCSALETLDLGPGWYSGYYGPGVFTDLVFDTRATFPVDMTDGSTVYAAGTPVPDGAGHYVRVSEETPAGEGEAGTASGAQPSLKRNPLKVKARSIQVRIGKKRAVKAARAFAVSRNKGGALSFKKLSGTKKIRVSKRGKVTVARSLRAGKHSVKVQVSAKATKEYAKATTTVTLRVTAKSVSKGS